jgi:hypothetical protein
MGCAQATAEGMPELQDPQMEVAAEISAVGSAGERLSEEWLMD